MEEYDDIDEDDQPRVAYVDVEREVASRDTRRRRDPRATATRSGPARTARRAAAGATPRTARRSRADIPSGEAFPGRFRGHRTTTATARSLPRSPTMTTTTSIPSARPRDDGPDAATTRDDDIVAESPPVPSAHVGVRRVARRGDAPPPPRPRPRPPTPTATFEEALGSSAAAAKPHGVDDLATAPAKIPTRRHQEEHGEDERRGGGGASSRGGAIESLRVHRGGSARRRPIGGVDARRPASAPTSVPRRRVRAPSDRRPRRPHSNRRPRG